MTRDEIRGLVFLGVALVAAGASGLLRANLEAAAAPRWLMDTVQWQAGFIVGIAFSWWLLRK